MSAKFIVSTVKSRHAQRAQRISLKVSLNDRSVKSSHAQSSEKQPQYMLKHSSVKSTQSQTCQSSKNQPQYLLKESFCEINVAKSSKNEPQCLGVLPQHPSQTPFNTPTQLDPSRPTLTPPDNTTPNVLSFSQSPVSLPYSLYLS